jgi:hypothetical protein
MIFERLGPCVLVSRRVFAKPFLFFWEAFSNQGKARRSAGPFSLTKSRRLRDEPIAHLGARCRTDVARALVSTVFMNQDMSGESHFFLRPFYFFEI